MGIGMSASSLDGERRSTTATMVRLDKSLAPSALVLIGLIATASAATYMFTQSFQPVSISTALITSNCSSLEPRTQSLVRGASPDEGYLLFTCPGPSKAFTVITGPLLATPSYTLPSGYTNMSAVAFNAGSTTCTGSGFLSNGAPVSLSSNSYSYCVGYDIVAFQGGTLSTFTVSWSWNQ